MTGSYIHRELEKKLTSLSKSSPSIALTGPRQSGKSTLLKHLFGKTHRYVTFDDPLIREKAILDPELFLEENSDKLILDEIQYVPEILSYLKILIDEKRNKAGRFIITGSQQFTLIKNLGDSLAGRIALLELLPFSTNEIKDKLENKKSVLDLFIYSCLNGLYPELVTKRTKDLDNWYAAYINTYLERDIRTIYDIGNLRDFSRFLQLLASRTGQILNLSTFASEIGISVNAIKKWVSILEASRIIYLLSPYYETMGKRISKSPKVYFLDCGLVCYLTGITNKSHLIKGPMAGQLFETFCIQETVKTFFNSGEKPNIFYIRTQNDLEVDLIVKLADKLYPIEIKLNKTPKVSMANSIRRFKETFTSLNIQNGFILSLSSEEHYLSKEVRLINFDSYINFLKKS